MYIRSIDKNENKIEIELQDTDFKEENVNKDEYRKEMVDTTISKDEFFEKYQTFIDNIVTRSFAMIFGNGEVYTSAVTIGEINQTSVIEIYYREGIDEELINEIEEMSLEDIEKKNRHALVIMVPKLASIEKIIDLVNSIDIMHSTLSKDQDTYYLTITTARRFNLDYILLNSRIREFAELVDKKKGLPLINEDAIQKLKIVFKKMD